VAPFSDAAWANDRQLGGSSADDDGHYVLGDDALACLRDLKRWLKLYDEKTNRLDVARCLAEAKLVTGDLLPILASWPEESKNDRLKARVALACLEILVPLTWPLETGGEMTVNHHRHTPYLQQAQVLYKAGILSWDTCKILRQVVRIGLPSIAIPRDERTSRDEGIIKLMLYFFRNLAVIRQVPNLPSQGLDLEVSRSTTIEAFRDQDVFALLLTICSNMGDDFNLQDVIVLDILFNLIKGVDVKKLWMTDAERRGHDLSDLKAALTIEDGLARDAKKHEWSRHGRFGTMIWIKREGEKVSAVSGQDNLKDGSQALFNMDKSKKWSKPQQKRKDLEHTIHDFDHATELTPHASEKLRNFVEEFLDSGFNPLFTHLRKAIEREAERLLDINYRQFFYTVSWFLEAERVRREKQKKEVKPGNIRDEFEDESFSLVAAVLNQETFILLNRYMQTAYDSKEWQDLNASMRCFTHILLTVQEMANSPVEEDQEIADNIQNRIFYEETTHDRIASILKGYKDQGLGYLDTCTELAHVFLRMLERYSKENVDLQIRSRRRARRKKKAARQQASADAEDVANDNDDEVSENEDIADVVRVSKERKFDFKRFSAKFTSQSSVNTFVALTTFYRDLNVEQLKRAHRFFYRVAFKQDMAVLLYRVDIVALFYKMVKGPEGLDVRHAMYREWAEFCRQLFKKMFKKLDQRPELIVELLFGKINSTLYYLEFGHEKQTLETTRAPAELEVKPAPGRDVKEQIGIVVAVLVQEGKSALVHWVQDVLGKAVDERHGWEAEAEVRKAAAIEAAHQDDEEPRREMDVGKPSYISVRPTSEEIKTAMFKNARLKLLMRLAGFEILEGEDMLGASWVIPSALSSERLQESKTAIEQYEATPWQPEDDDEAPEDLIRRVRHPNQRADDEAATGAGFIDDSEGDDQVEEFLFPDNLRKRSSKPRNLLEELKARRRKRKRDEEGDGEVDEELAAQRRKAREAAALERRRRIKSELYIRDSDEETDQERDQEFYRKEEEVRRRQEENIRHQMALNLAAQSSTGKRGNSAHPANQQETQSDLSERDDEDMIMLDEEEEEPNDTASSQPRRPFESGEESEEETPPSSQSSARRSPRALKELPQPTLAPTPGLKGVASDEQGDNDDQVVLPGRRHQIRGGFIVDSDDE